MNQKLTRTFIFILFFILGWLLAGCSENLQVEDSPMGKLLKGEHPLNELQVKGSTKPEDAVKKPTYFLFSTTSMTFNVTLNDSTIVTMNLPMSRVRFRYDETITQPYVKFKWQKGGDVNDVWSIQNQILYVILFVKKDDIVYDPTIVQ